MPHCECPVTWHEKTGLMYTKYLFILWYISPVLFKILQLCKFPLKCIGILLEYYFYQCGYLSLKSKNVLCAHGPYFLFPGQILNFEHWKVFKHPLHQFWTTVYHIAQNFDRVSDKFCWLAINLSKFSLLTFLLSVFPMKASIHQSFTRWSFLNAPFVKFCHIFPLSKFCTIRYNEAFYYLIVKNKNFKVLEILKITSMIFLRIIQWVIHTQNFFAKNWI